MKYESLFATVKVDSNLFSWVWLFLSLMIVKSIYFLYEFLNYLEFVERHEKCMVHFWSVIKVVLLFKFPIWNSNLEWALECDLQKRNKPSMPEPARPFFVLFIKMKLVVLKHSGKGFTSNLNLSKDTPRWFYARKRAYKTRKGWFLLKKYVWLEKVSFLAHNFWVKKKIINLESHDLVLLSLYIFWGKCVYFSIFEW